MSKAMIGHMEMETSSNGVDSKITGQFPLRFSGIGASPYQGRVEVLHNGIWGTVCDDKFGTEEAEVVCKMQGLLFKFYSQGGTVMPSGTFGFGQGQIWIDDLVCDGTERHLGQCQFCAWGVTNCKHEEDVGVQCRTPSTGAPPTVQPNNCTTTPAAPQQWDVRIVGPDNQKGLGFVEVYYNNQWSAVCDDLWGTNDARVICNMLCFDPVMARAGSVIEINYVRPNVSSTFALDDVVCQGNENSLRDCRFTTGAAIDCLAPYEYASVTCTNLNNSAPAPPTPTLDCSDGHIKASFSRKDDRYLEEKFLWIFNQTSGPCYPIKATGANFVSISIPFDECGTLTTSNESHIIYTNVIQYEYNSTNGNSLCGNSDYNSTKANIICVSYRIEVSCEFPRDLYAYKEMRPLIESATHNAPGMYRIRMDFFRNNSFISPVSNYPLNLTLGEWLYVSLTLENVDQNLKLIVPECVATPSTSYTDPTNHPLFKNKCQCDATLGFFPWNTTSSGFRYKACKFAQFELVYLHCKAFVCLLSEKTAECDRSCNSTIAGRRRRDVILRADNDSAKTDNNINEINRNAKTSNRTKINHDKESNTKSYSNSC
ncbi:deleted in malignant brain tumors 1 protein-like [Saccostrea echinata]|uniref:deleted in malignant brain tumors 1 protein-like n=1 Tax=Saccostrea echinata TaxID=191078 RepID=UPI002A812AA3|nr:deleted in malignant brain tumors 1 protein-like [Saccostrea echinata]